MIYTFQDEGFVITTDPHKTSEGGTATTVVLRGAVAKAGFTDEELDRFVEHLLLVRTMRQDKKLVTDL